MNRDSSNQKSFRLESFNSMLCIKKDNILSFISNEDVMKHPLFPAVFHVFLDRKLILSSNYFFVEEPQTYSLIQSQLNFISKKLRVLVAFIKLSCCWDFWEIEWSFRSLMALSTLPNGFYWTKKAKAIKCNITQLKCLFASGGQKNSFLSFLPDD